MKNIKAIYIKHGTREDLHGNFIHHAPRIGDEVSFVSAKVVYRVTSVRWIHGEDSLYASIEVGVTLLCALECALEEGTEC